MRKKGRLEWDREYKTHIPSWAPMSVKKKSERCHCYIQWLVPVICLVYYDVMCKRSGGVRRLSQGENMEMRGVGMMERLLAGVAKIKELACNRTCIVACVANHPYVWLVYAQIRSCD